MRSIRSFADGFGLRDREDSQRQSRHSREEAPAALIEAHAVSTKIRPALTREQIVGKRRHCEVVYIIHDYIVSGLVDTFADAFERALTRKKSYSIEEIVDLKAQAKDVMPDIVGRLLYLRLHNIAVAKDVNRDEFGLRPTIDPKLELPTPLARAITNIGIFRPMGVVQETTFVPSYGCDPGRAGGYDDRCQSHAYAKLFPVFAKCGITTSKVETRNCDGTSWYLLEAVDSVEHRDVFEVIATFPPQSGNVSVTDAITRTYCLHRDHPRSITDSGMHVRKHIYFIWILLVQILGQCSQM